MFAKCVRTEDNDVYFSSGWGWGGGERERENSNLKTVILKESSVRSIWTCLTASPEREREREGIKKKKRHPQKDGNVAALVVFVHTRAGRVLPSSCLHKTSKTASPSLPSVFPHLRPPPPPNPHPLPGAAALRVRLPLKCEQQCLLSQQTKGNCGLRAEEISTIYRHSNTTSSLPNNARCFVAARISTVFCFLFCCLFCRGIISNYNCEPVGARKRSSNRQIKPFPDMSQVCLSQRGSD